MPGQSKHGDQALDPLHRIGAGDVFGQAAVAMDFFRRRGYVKAAEPIGNNDF